MRLIDADALNKKLCETTIFIKGGEIFQRMINDAPTIEPDGDLISRQDAIDALMNDSDWADAIPTIASLPSAESTGAMDEAIQKYIKDGYMQPIGEDLSAPDSRQRGEWIWSPKDEDGTVSGCCSNCSFSHLFIGGHTAQYNFCPNCGADMRGES